MAKIQIFVLHSRSELGSQQHSAAGCLYSLFIALVCYSWLQKLHVSYGTSGNLLQGDIRSS